MCYVIFDRPLCLAYKINKEGAYMVGLLLLVATIILYYAIKYDKKRDSMEQSEAERRRGEAILRARAERTANEQANPEKKRDSVCSDLNEENARKGCGYVERTYHVAGTTFNENAILSLSSENPDYEMSKRDLIDSGMTDEKIWEYEFDPSNVELIPEPENPHDPNAVKVVVDGEHVGYIKKGSCKHILKLIAEDRILRIDCKMGGGNYKIVSEDYDDEKDKEVYTLERDKTNYFVVLTIREKA